MYVFAANSFEGVSDEVTQMLVRHAGLVDESVFGGSPDKRSNGNRAMKTEIGQKSTGRGYAVGNGTRWLVGERMGTTEEVALGFDEMFDVSVMVDHWKNGKEGRPPLPELRAGHYLLEVDKDLKAAFATLAKQADAAKHAVQPESAREDAAATAPTQVEVTGKAGRRTSELAISLLGTSYTGATWNMELVNDGSPLPKLEQEGSLSPASRKPHSLRISDKFPAADRGSGHAHADNYDKQKHRIAHLGLKHSSLAALFLYAYDPYDLLIGGEFNLILSDSQGQALPRRGATLHVSPHKAPLLLGHQSAHWHMPSCTKTMRALTDDEPDAVASLQTGSQTRQSAHQVMMSLRLPVHVAVWCFTHQSSLLQVHI